jgi:hypothetical protein
MYSTPRNTGTDKSEVVDEDEGVARMDQILYVEEAMSLYLFAKLKAPTRSRT